MGLENNSKRTCLKCGWVGFAVTREHAENEVERFNQYFASLSKEEQNQFYRGKKSSIKNYERCFLCGGPHTNFREAKEGDYPMGCTLNPIIFEEGNGNE